MNVLVVGGTRGIGRAVVDRLAREHTVAVIARRPYTGDKHDRVQYYECDITSTDISEFSSHHGRFDGVVFAQRYRGDDLDDEFDVSVRATRDVLCELTGHLNASASVVIISSTNANLVNIRQPAMYHIAKGAAVQLARYYAVTMGPIGVRVNAVLAGTVIKPENEDYFKTASVRRTFEKASPLKRLGRAEEIAKVVAFLISDDSSWITGQAIVVDGGSSLECRESYQ